MKLKRYSVLYIGTFLACLCFEAGTCKQKEDDLISKARTIHDKALTVDSHADTPALLLRESWDMGKRHETASGNDGKVDLPRMREGGLDAEVFVVCVGQGALTPEGYSKAREKADNQLAAIHKMCIDYPDLVELAISPEDAYRIEKLGKRAAFIGLENGYPMGKDISLLRAFYDKGVRYLTLCHSANNDMCASSTDRFNLEDKGLSDFGKKVVAECNRLGIMVDISHLSDKSFFDVLEVSHSPVIASHSSVRAQCNNPRNLSDEMLKALKTNEGVIQICFYSEFIRAPRSSPERERALEKINKTFGFWGDVMDETKREKREQEYSKIMEKYPEEKATLKELVDHIDYVVSLIGIDHVGIGTDFDGGGEVKGCVDISEMHHVTEELLRRGYSEDEIQKIWGGNFLRVFKKTIEIASKNMNMGN